MRIETAGVTIWIHMANDEQVAVHETNMFPGMGGTQKWMVNNGQSY